jgi:hypothetical protein
MSTCFKNEQRQNLKEGFEHEPKKKTHKRKTKIKMETTGSEICQAKGTWEENEKEQRWEDRQT